MNGEIEVGDLVKSKGGVEMKVLEVREKVDEVKVEMVGGVPESEIGEESWESVTWMKHTCTEVDEE